MSKRSTTEEFIEKARKVHGDKYDYSKVKYVNNSTKVCIICPTHGEFWQAPRHHTKGHGCPLCGGTQKLSVEEFIEKARKIHGNKYDYSKVRYFNCDTKVCIICPIHGEFWQSPTSHLTGKGCPSCGGTQKLNIEKFINIAKKVHGDKYDYSKVEYVNSHTKVCVICPIHGEFWQTPQGHLNGRGCLKCANRNITTEEFIEKARKVHGDKYDYSKVEYVNSQTKVCIICPTHGEFWQRPNSHLMGNGCASCNESKLENAISVFFYQHNIQFERQKRFTWLRKQSLDFYLPEYNIGIECQGEQHFKLKDFFGGNKEFKKIVERDIRKNKLCKENGINILYYSNLGINYPYHVYENKEELLKEITK